MGDILKLQDRFPSRNLSKCSVGKPVGEGLRLGYEGWGDADIVLDPGLPLDMQVDTLGLAGIFDEVRSVDLLHRLHGDCTLTHGLKGISKLAKQGATIFVEYLDISEIMKYVLMEMNRGQFARAQALEKLCFDRPIDKGMALFPQTLISLRKMQFLLADARIFKREILHSPCLCEVPIFPDEVRLDGIPDKVWEESAENFKRREKILEDRPNCVLCKRVVTKRDHDRQFFSRYCKEHYYMARKSCDSLLRDSFSAKIIGKRY